MKVILQFLNGDEREYELAGNNENELIVNFRKLLVSKPILTFDNGTTLYKADMIVKIVAVE